MLHREARVGWILAIMLVLALLAPSAALAGVCSPPDNGPLPSPWLDQDITASGGCAGYNGGIFTVKSKGNVLWGTSDSFHFAYRDFTGDFQIVTRVKTLQYQDSAAGLMVRENLTAGSRHASIVYSNQSGLGGTQHIGTVYRSIAGERTFGGGGISPVQLELYLKVIRYKDQITLYYSPDNITWSWVEGTTLTGLASTVKVGLAVVSNDPNSVLTGTFDQVTVSSYTPPYPTSWLGNSFPGGGSHVPQDVYSIYVHPTTNKILTNVVWDEGGSEVTIFNASGGVERKLDDTHGYSRYGGYAVTTNGTYIYMAMTQQYFTDPGYPPLGTTWFCVRRFKMDGTPAPWTGGGGYDGSMLIVKQAADGTDAHLRGLAVNPINGTTNSELYVSDSSSNMVRVYNGNTMAPLPGRDFAVTRPRSIAFTNGILWIVQAKIGTTGNDVGKVLKYTIAGGKLDTEITNVDTPTGVAVIGNGTKIWVTDAGPSYQQVRIFNASTGSLSGTFGDAGGIYSIAGGSKRGETRPTKFNGPVGIGFDSSDNVYVAGNGVGVDTGTELRKFDSSNSHNLVWERFGLEFVDTADGDTATDGADLFTRQTHYTMNYNNPTGQEWTYKGVTLDQANYPEDGRFHEDDLGGWAGAIVRRLDGQRIMYLTTHYGQYLGIYRFDPNSEIAIPCGLLNDAHVNATWPPNQPASGKWIWRDGTPANGLMEAGEYESNGGDEVPIWAWTVTDNGDLWTADQVPNPSSTLPIKRYRYKGLDSNNCPIYHGTNQDPICSTIPCTEEFVKPAEFGPVCDPAQPCSTGVTRAFYVAPTDTMYLSGYTTAKPRDTLEDGDSRLGTEVIRYNNWHACASSTQNTCTPAWRVNDLPYANLAPPPSLDYLKSAKGMDVTGDRLFVGLTHNAEVRVYNACTGSYLSSLTPGPEVAGKSGKLISPAGMNAFQRSNGEFRVFAEELLNSKVLMYKLQAPTCGPCQTQYCTGVDVGCTATGTCGLCGCCNYTCGVSLPGCTGLETPPANRCQ
jgi:hypothetical protein